ncbi:MAG: NAD(P)H-binding protein [Rhodothermaceae bacterium]|nr:NAD(P)H-binding protein [Rhodothermaceae bacterium]
MHVFLTGASGFIGSYILKDLIAAGHTVRCLMRDTKGTLSVEDDSIERVKGDLTKPKSLTGLLRGCDAVIHLVGIIKEIPSRNVTFDALHFDATKNVVDEAVDSGITQFIQMSANGARSEGISGYQTSKWRAEEYVKKADFDRWTIFRPSVVFGAPSQGQPEFASQLISTLIRPFPVLPVFGDGRYEMQPVSVHDVSAGFVQALTVEASWKRSFCVAGQLKFTYSEILNILAKGAGIEPKLQINQPVWMVRPVIHTVGKTGALPITPDQFEMLLEGNTCDSSSFFEHFDLPNITFSPENLSYLSSY